MAQNQPLQQAAAEELDNSLFESTMGLLGIDLSEDNLLASRWFLPIRDSGMGLASAHHSCDALFMDAWLQALDRGATRHNLPDAASMLEALPPIQGALRTSAQSLRQGGDRCRVIRYPAGLEPGRARKEMAPRHLLPLAHATPRRSWQ